MLKSKLGKKFAAIATTLAMVASASASSIATLTASAGVMTGEGTFEEGAGLPWHVCENGTASMSFNINDGVYSILINNPGGASNGGDDRWDCQFRHRGFTVHYGHRYRITYSIYATQSGKFYTKLGDINNDDAEYWHWCGNKVSMDYEPGLSMSELEDKLKSASGNAASLTANSSDWDVPYWVGWNEWENYTLPAKTWTTFAWDFVISDQLMANLADKGQPAPDGKGTVEWCFHFGGDGPLTPGGCFKEGTIIKFDNMMLVDMDCDKDDYKEEVKPEKTGVVANQLGYYPNLNKVATVQVASGAAPVSFEVKTASGTSAYKGTGSATKLDEAAGEYCQTLDFSELTTPGEYYVEVDGKKSFTFTIGDGIYDGLLADALNYYYLNRSGIDIEEKYIQNGGKNEKGKAALARKAGHKPDEAYVTDEWVFIYSEKTNADVAALYSKKIDVSGGWYDAGDYGKYVVNGGVSMWTLANIYERTMKYGDSKKFADGASIMTIPETGNGTPDILDELKWEADFFIKMQRDDGMVYHKMHDYKWTALGVMPYDDNYTADETADTNFPTRIIKPVTYAATLNTAGALAQLARLLKDAGDSSASTYQAAAEKAYKAAKDLYVKNYGDIYADAKDATTNELFAPLDQNKGGGPYGDTQVTDEFYWAACELYITTGDSSYYDDLKKYPEAFGVTTNLVGGENQGSPTSFTWGTLAALGTASLALHDEVLTPDENKKVVTAFQEAGDYYLKVESESMYGTSYPGHTYDTTVTDIIGDTASERAVTLTGGYEWGSNSMVINNAMILGMAYDVTKDVKYVNGVTSAMDYILGRNPMENSYVTGYGTSTTSNPHHRYWCQQLKPDWPSAPNGCLSGGPNSDMNDPMIQGAGYKIGELAPMKCYYDNVDAWSVNEITINWNAPLVWIASFVEDVAPNVTDDPQQPTTKPTEDSSGSDGDILYGDTDCNGTVNLVDVVLLNKNLMVGTPITPQGVKNGDVDRDGALSAIDSLNILKACIDLVTLPVA